MKKGTNYHNGLNQPVKFTAVHSQGNATQRPMNGTSQSPILSKRQSYRIKTPSQNFFESSMLPNSSMLLFLLFL